MFDTIATWEVLEKQIEKYNLDSDVNRLADLSRAGNHKILVSFKINKKGKTVDIKAKGSIPELEIEAIRVVNSLPIMEPGIHKGKKVNVLYSLPIKIQGAM